jgi:hemerythrin-like metal-binding protein
MTHYAWNDRLLTGFDEVDAQHRRLFALLDGLATRAEEGVSLDEIRQAIAALVQYAQTHFDDELALMQARRCDLRHVMMHVQEHGSFIRRVSLFDESLAAGGGDARQKATELARFLVDWLRHHIQIVDQLMASQLRRIAAGESPADAYAAEIGSHPEARVPHSFTPAPAKK